MASSSAAYEHSKVFAQIKAVKETIKGNLTTHQYLKALDTYLAKAMSPLMPLNDNFAPYVLQLLDWQELNPKRKVSLLSKDDFRVVALRYLAKENLDWASLKLDRLLVVQFVESQLKLYQPVLDCHDGTQGFRSLEAELTGLHSLKLLTSKVPTAVLLEALRSSKYWLQAAGVFKNQVLEKYYRLCLTTAQQDYTNFFDKKCKLDDIIQVYVQAASRGLDKCDATQGVLTTHIQYWLYTARTSVHKSLPKELNIDDSLPTEDFSDSVEGESYTLDAQLEAQSDSNDLAFLLALVDPLGAARAYLGINETVDTLNSSKAYFTWREECLTHPPS